MAIEYRPAEPRDYETVRRFLSDLGWDSRVRDAARVTRMLEAADRTVVAWEGDRIVGFGRALCDGVSNGYLGTIAVAADKRRQGIGTEIVRRLMAPSGDDAADEVTWVLRAGRDSGGFWSKLGFKPSGVAMERLRRADRPSRNA